MKKQYWVLVWCDRQDDTRNGTPVPLIESLPGSGFRGMMVFEHESEAVIAAKHQANAYGITCRAVLLGSERSVERLDTHSNGSTGH